MSEFGMVNGHVIGIVMKEAVRRALTTIRRERFRFGVETKAGYDGAEDDVVTSADRAAQEVYLRSLRECFPDFGIVAEEEELSVPSGRPGMDLFFTAEPLDGTKAFVRRQSSGIGTMLALVRDGEVIGAFVGDVMTQELYGFRPGSEEVHRISEFEVSERLEVDVSLPLTAQYVSLQEVPEDHTRPAQSLVRAMGGVEVSSGSIGTQGARIWKGSHRSVTVCDSTPPRSGWHALNPSPMLLCG